MRKIYLVRHGQPEMPDGRKYCIGKTEAVLSCFGRLQAALAGEYTRSMGARAVFSSCQLRAVETAASFGREYETVMGLQEADAGIWDGLAFDEIRCRWTELYAARGEDRGILPPGGEDYDSQLSRFSRGLSTAEKSAEGDFVLISHLCVMQTFLGSLLGLEPNDFRRLEIPCGSITTLEYDGQGGFNILSMGQLPALPLTDGLCKTLLSAAGADKELCLHCAAVSKKTAALCGKLKAAGLELDTGLARAAAALHDIARGHSDHAAVGGEWLRELGYPRHGEIIARHMDIEPGAPLDESAVVFIADKLVKGGRAVTLAERFDGSLGRCTTPQALAAHNARRQAAMNIAEKINNVYGKELIK